MIRRLPIAPALFAALVAVAGTAVAQPVRPTPEGAARLKAIIDAEWERLDQLMPEGFVFARDGTVSVEIAGMSYRVRMPRTRLNMMGEASLDLGVMEAIGRPGPDETVELTSPLPGLVPAREPASGKTLAELRIGSGTSRVVYSMRDGRAASSATEANDIGVAITGDDTKSLTVSRIAFEERGTTLADGRRDDESQFTIEGVEFTDTQSDAYVGIGRVAARGRSKGVDRAAVEALNVGFAAFARAAERGEADAGRLLPLIPRLRDVADGIEVTVEMADMAVYAPDGTGFELGRLAYGAAVTGLRSGWSRVELGFSLSDLAFDGIPVPEAAVPERIALRLALDRIPNAVIGDAVQELTERAAKGEDATQAAPALGLGLLGALTQAETEFRIEEAALITSAFGLSADGAAKLDPASPMMATATLGVTLSGLERVGPLLDELPMMNPRERTDARAVLALIQALGQPASDAGGKPARRYVFAVDPAGRLTLNGADLQPIIESITRMVR
jgi:hypothetical protein